jgi:opacity protein-like surface antigen
MNMRSLKSFAVAGAMAMGAATSVLAADLGAPPPPAPAFDAPLRGTVSSGVYLRGDIGVGVTNIGKFDSATYRGGVAANTIQGLAFSGQSHPTPVFIGLGIGYRFNSWLRGDVTVEHRAGTRFGYTDRFIQAPGGVAPVVPGGGVTTNTFNGNLSSTVAMVNGYLDLGTFCAFGCLTPYIGAGIGMTQNSVKGLSEAGFVVDQAATVTSPVGGVYRDKSRTNLAWAIHAGLGYAVTPNVTLELGYRYLNLGRAVSGAGVNSFNGAPLAAIEVRDITSHDVKIGMRWALGGDCCGSPEPMPMPVPAPMVRKF